MGRQLSSVYVVIALVSNINHVKICGGRFGEFRFESVVPPPFLRRMANYITKDIKDLVIVLDSDEGPVA